MLFPKRPDATQMPALVLRRSFVLASLRRVAGEKEDATHLTIM